MQQNFDIENQHLKNMRDTAIAEIQVELDIKKVIIEKNKRLIHDLKQQLTKLIKLTKYPRIVKMLHDKFEDA